MKTTFSIVIGEEDGWHCAIIKSVQESKARSIKAENIRLLMAAITKLVRKRNQHLRRFPLPDPSPIITLEQDAIGQNRLILPSNGN